MAYVDLDELPSLLGGRLERARPGLLRFRRRDYLGDREAPLADAVRDTVAEHTGSRPSGPVRVLTQLRSFGHCFNPVSFYYCISADGERVEAILTEVTNTPWGERHSLRDRGRRCSRCWGKLRQGDARVTVHADGADLPGARDRPRADAVGAHREPRSGRPAFDATLSLQRRELTRSSARRLTLRYPLATVRVLALIYGHAVGLKLRRRARAPAPQDAVGVSDWIARLLGYLLLRRIAIGQPGRGRVGESAEVRHRSPDGDGRAFARRRAWRKLLRGSRRAGRGLRGWVVGLARPGRGDPRWRRSTPPASTGSAER